METVYQFLVAAHLTTVAAVFVAVIVNLRRRTRPASSAVQIAAALQLATGLALAGLLYSGATDGTPNGPKLALKLLVAVAVTALAYTARASGGRPRRLLAGAGVLTTANVLVATLW
jgi:hypothetical protein